MRVFAIYLYCVIGLAALVSTEAVCRRGCTRIYYPVCGYRALPGAAPEYRNFGNHCEYDLENCLHPERAYEQIGEDGEPCE